MLISKAKLKGESKKIKQEHIDIIFLSKFYTQTSKNFLIFLNTKHKTIKKPHHNTQTTNTSEYITAETREKKRKSNLKTKFSPRFVPRNIVPNFFRSPFV